MRFTDDDRTTLRINEHMSLRGIPTEAHEYQVNGRTPLEWLIDRYRIARDRQSGIVNDPNAWFPDPRALPAALRRIVHLSVETPASSPPCRMSLTSARRSPLIRSISEPKPTVHRSSR